MIVHAVSLIEGISVTEIKDGDVYSLDRHL